MSTHRKSGRRHTSKQRRISEWTNDTYPGGALLALLRRPSHWKRTLVTRRPAAMEPVAGLTPLHINGKTRTSLWVNMRVTPKSITYSALQMCTEQIRIRKGQWTCQKNLTQREPCQLHLDSEPSQKRSKGTYVENVKPNHLVEKQGLGGQPGHPRQGRHKARETADGL